MPINTDKLIAAPMLQDLLVDKYGEPMANGTITLYHDLNRSFLKNWYYQTGTPGKYMWLPLPNPLTLSAAGTISDVNGVDTIPFYYPYLETDEDMLDPYYIVILSQDGTTQITRANFPYISPESSGPILETSLNNLIINNGFWRNLVPNTVNTSPLNTITINNYAVDGSVQLIVAPSQHDGFSMPDIQFLKNNTSATDLLTFTPFPLENQLVIDNTNTPEYYISHNCTSAGTGETQKCYQFPIALHINNLANVNFTVSIQAQNAGATGGSAGTIQLRILQFTGTGTTSPMPSLVAEKSLELTTAWDTYTLTDVFAPSSGLTLGAGADDAFYLQVWMPFNTACTINFTKPCLYLTENIVPAYDFQTYDQVDAVINSPRTGDIRVSVNTFYPFGWVPLNDLLIGISNTHNSTSYIRANADTWPLFNLLYTLALPYDSGTMFNPICQLYEVTSMANTAINYSGNAYNDFIGNSGQNALQLTRTMGRVLLGGVPIPALSAGGYAQAVTSFANSGGNMLIKIANLSPIYQGMPVTFTGTLPSTVGANIVYYVTGISSSLGGFFLSYNYADAIANVIEVVYAGGGGAATVYTSLSGTSLGEYQHTQLAGEIVNHTHNLIGITGTSVGLTVTSGASTILQTGGGSAVTGGVTGLTQVPFNVTQPATYYNMYMKL